jgi:PhzF family phenazine biosynthesis protein
MKKGFSLPMPMYHVDAFTDRPFAGNPAAVCFLTDQRPASWMQAVAAEMNLSETAFFRPTEEGTWQLRWFTPQVEVDLCGHATLATAHVIWTTDMADHQETLRFMTRSGVLSARRDGAQIVLDFPAKGVAAAPPPSGLIEALGQQAVHTAFNQMDWLVELADETSVRQLQPDLTSLAHIQARGIIVTARADAGQPYHFVSRFFGPAVGVPEDPVTGSAHCALAPYWKDRLGMSSMIGYQASQRGGMVGVRLHADRPGRVELLGQAITTMQGVITVEALAWKDSE